MNTKRLNPYRLYLILEGLTSLAFAMIFMTSMIYQVSVVKLSPLQLVLVGTMLESIVFIFEVPTGIVADVYSRRLSVIIGIILTGLGFMTEGLFPYFGTILLAQVGWGLGATFMSGALNAWMVDEVGENNAGPAFMRAAQVGQLTGLVGLLAGVIFGSLRINLPIILGSSLLILLGGFLALFMPETNFKPTPREDRTTWQNMTHTFKNGAKLVRMRPALMTFLGISFIGGLYSEGFDRLRDAHLLRNFSFPDLTLPVVGDLKPVVWFGIINVVGMLMSAAVTEVLRRRVNTRNERLISRILLTSDAIMIVGILSYAWAGSFAVAVGALLLARLMRTLPGPLYQTWLNQHIDSDVRATVLSMDSQLNALGQIAGGPAVGAVGSYISIRAALTISAFILSPGLYLYHRAGKYKSAVATEATTEVIVVTA
ncbi:MAG: MFS transporter [Chloroflexi bacterium]|nr:MFS transporter [Chloroflexota bacterium]